MYREQKAEYNRLMINYPDDAYSGGKSKMKKIRLLVLGLMTLSLLLAACSSQAYSEAPAYDSFGEYSAPEGVAVMEMEAAEFADDGGNMSAYDSGTASNYVVTQRIVIMNADLSIVVDDPVDNMEIIVGLANELGGFVVSSQQYMTYANSGVEVPVADITIRVPAEDLYDTLDKIKALVDDQETDIRNESVSGQDVTQEYTDLRSRLTNLEFAEKQLQAIMEEAYKTDDVLAVYRELTLIQEEIEVIKGKIRYYEESAALSAISVSLVAKESIQPLTVGKWEPKGVALDAVQALIDALKFFAEAGIWLVLFFLPVLLILATPVVVFILLVRWFIRKLRKGRKTKAKGEASDASEEKSG